MAFATRRDCEIVRLDYLKDLNLPKYPLMFDEEKQEFNWNFIREWFYLDEGKKYEKYLCTRQKISTNQFSWVWGLKN